MKRIVTNLIFVFILIFIFSVPYTNATTQYDGNWSGDTSDGKEISFIVENDQITSMTINLLMCRPTVHSVTACGKVSELSGSFCISGEVIADKFLGTSYKISSYKFYAQTTITIDNCTTTIGDQIVGFTVINGNNEKSLLSGGEIESDGTFSVSADFSFSTYPTQESLKISITGSIQNYSASGEMQQTWTYTDSDGTKWPETNDEIKWSAKNGDHIQQYTLSITKDGTGNGTVKSKQEDINCGLDCLGKYEENTAITITAVPNSDSVFSGWTGGNCGKTESCAFTINDDTAITANFEQKYEQKYTLTVKKDGWGSGTIKSEVEGINCGTDCSEKYGKNTVVKLTAIPDDGYIFDGWEGDYCSGTENCEIALNYDITVTAIFEKESDSSTMDTADTTTNTNTTKDKDDDGGGGGGGCFIHICNQ